MPVWAWALACSRFAGLSASFGHWRPVGKFGHRTHRRARLRRVRVRTRASMLPPSVSSEFPYGRSPSRQPWTMGGAVRRRQVLPTHLRARRGRCSSVAELAGHPHRSGEIGRLRRAIRSHGFVRCEPLDRSTAGSRQRTTPGVMKDPNEVLHLPIDDAMFEDLADWRPPQVRATPAPGAGPRSTLGRFMRTRVPIGTIGARCTLSGVRGLLPPAGLSHGSTRSRSSSRWICELRGHRPRA